MRLIDAEVAKEMLVNHAKEFSDVMNRKEKALLIGGGGSCIDKCPTIEVPRWIPVTERLPELIPCTAGTAYSEAVNVLTSGRKVLTAIYDGIDFIADAEFWDAVTEDITHWTPVLLPLPTPPKDCEYCKFYENECEAHSQMETIGQKRGMEICELFCLPDAPKDGDT